MAIQNKRILFTAPRQYARKLSSLLIDAGARPIWVPTIEITHLPPAECPKIDAVMDRLSEFSHIAFTSKNGIDAVFERLRNRFSSSEEIVEYINQCDVQICALGADAEQLKNYEIRADIVPVDASTLGLVKELHNRGELNGSKILCPVPSVRGGLTEPAVVPRFLRALKDGGADVVRLDAYVTQVGCRYETCGAERQLLQNGDIDVILFSSTAEAQGLIQCMGSLESLQEWITQTSTILAAHGPFTAAGVESCLGLIVRVVSKNYRSFDGVICALEQFFSSESVSISDTISS